MLIQSWIKALALAALVAICADAIYISGDLGTIIGRQGQINVDGALKAGISPSIRLPATIEIPNELKSTEIKKKIAELNNTKTVSSSRVIIQGQTISVPILTDQNLDKNKDAVSETMNSFADRLKSLTDEGECDCDPKDSSKSVRQVVEATSRLCQDLLRCLLDTLKKSVSSREATLLRAITKESMDALSRSVDGIYSIWKMSGSQESKSVQAVIDGLMNVLNRFSSRLTTAL